MRLNLNISEVLVIANDNALILCRPSFTTNCGVYRESGDIFPPKTKQMFAEDTEVEGSDHLKFYIIIIIGTKVQHFISYDRLPDIINCIESFQRTVTKQNGRLCTKAD